MLQCLFMLQDGFVFVGEMVTWKLNLQGQP